MFIPPLAPPAQIKSAAVPPLALPADQPDWNRNAFFRNLREMIAECGPEPKKHDLVKTLIIACIEEGVNEGKRIVGVIHHLGFNKSFVGIMLEKGGGTDPARFWWRRGQDGRYSILVSCKRAEASREGQGGQRLARTSCAPLRPPGRRKRRLC